MTVTSGRRAAAVGLFALATFAGAACDQQASCRPGTIFVRVDLGPFTTADTADVSVSVAGATSLTTSLPLAAGARAGGVEVVFPHGYPSGKAVDIRVTLKANGTPVAERHETLGALRSGCDVLDEMFTSSDAITGAGGTGGSATGAGGSGGAAGEAGTLGGGATGGSVAGTSGGGRGGAGGTVGGSGGSGPCVSTGAESCFNGRDDDCDGLPDCADPDCAPVAQCVPFDPLAGGRIGVVVSTLTTCPIGYTDQFTIMSGMSAGGCSGCSCRPGAVTCSTNISSFGSGADCNNSGLTGRFETTFSSTQPCTAPSWIGSTLGTIYGVQATPFIASPNGACTPQGAPTPSAVSWASTMRFCAAPMVGTGCGAQACVPLISPAKCAMYDGVQRCQPGATSTSWNTGASDSRTCGACSCGSPTGGSCSGMVLNVGSDFACMTVTATLSSGQRRCYAGSGVNSPGVIFSGTPTQTTCSASAPLSGSVMATGSKTLCCM